MQMLLGSVPSTRGRERCIPNNKNRNIWQINKTKQQKYLAKTPMQRAAMMIKCRSSRPWHYGRERRNGLLRFFSPPPGIMIIIAPHHLLVRGLCWYGTQPSATANNNGRRIRSPFRSLWQHSKYDTERNDSNARFSSEPNRTELETGLQARP